MVVLIHTTTRRIGFNVLLKNGIVYPCPTAVNIEPFSISVFKKHSFFDILNYMCFNHRQKKNESIKFKQELSCSGVNLITLLKIFQSKFNDEKRNSGTKNDKDLLKTIPLGYLKTYNNDPCQKNEEKKIRDMGYKDIYGNNRRIYNMDLNKERKKIKEKAWTSKSAEIEYHAEIVSDKMTIGRKHAKKGNFQTNNTSYDPVRGDGIKTNIFKYKGEYYIKASDISKILH
ncbi:hypothetical protein H8356DRAFT_1357426 [Neocallimastix lanati (nom. inval.)]|nr:hypothetical protein H8356DRAFT_1357426 [Neocallimastix sp. JGI-2020a]